MTTGSFLSFLALAVVLTLIPGPDFAVVARNVLAAGRRQGLWAAVGIATGCLVQGIASAAGLGAAIVASQPLFEAIRWTGAAYLALLGLQSLARAWRGRYPAAVGLDDRPRYLAAAGFRQGFLSNITNPKVLVFYLAVLPQFLARSAEPWQVLVLVVTHAVIGLSYLAIVTVALHRVRAVLSGNRVRRALDGVMGVAFLAFGARLLRR